MLVIVALLAICFGASYTADAEANKSNVGFAISAPQSAPTPCPTCGGEEDKPHTLAASYYSVKNGLNATLMLNNKGPKPLEVKPTLYSLDGQVLDLLPVVVEGNSSREIDIREFGIANTGFEEGSLQLFHHGKDLVLGAQVKLINLQQSLIFEEKLLEIATEIGARRLEGLWYLPTPKTRVHLILSNTSAETIPATIRIEGIAPKQIDPLAITLNPHETRVLDAAHDITENLGGTLKNIGGITVEHSNSAGSLLARILIEDADTGYSSSLRFYDSQKAKSTKLQGAGLRIGEIEGERLTPLIVARNVGDSPTTITGRIPYTKTNGEMGAVALPALRLTPGEIKMIQTVALKRSGIESSVVTAGLEFEYTGNPGSVIMSAQSMTKNGDLSFTVPMWDILAQRSSTGGYPWIVEGDSSTVVYIKNVTSNSQKYTLELSFTGGVYSLGLNLVEAGQTVTLDIRKLRDDQVPDARGQTVPVEATRGQVHWSLNGSDSRALIGRSEQVDVRNGLSSSYACQNCCQDTFHSGWIESGSLGNRILPDYDAPELFSPFEQDISCYGTLLEPFNPEASMSSADWNIAECGSPSGMVHGINPGITSISASWIAYQPFREVGGTECVVQESNVLAETFCEVLQRQPHRGRFQAQGERPPVEKSEPWAQSEPLLRSEGINLLNALWEQLTPTEKRERNEAFQKATQFVASTPEGGVNGPYSNSWKGPANRRDPDARIDLEVKAGIAFVSAP